MRYIKGTIFSFFLFCAPLAWAVDDFSFHQDRYLQHAPSEVVGEVIVRDNLLETNRFYSVNDLPTIQESLKAHLERHPVLLTHEAGIYCTPDERHNITPTQRRGTVYLASDELPTSVPESPYWFEHAHNFSPSDKQRHSNVVIVSAKKRPFLRTQCPHRLNRINVHKVNSGVNPYHIISIDGRHAGRLQKQDFVDPDRPDRTGGRISLLNKDKMILPSNYYQPKQRSGERLVYPGHDMQEEIMAVPAHPDFNAQPSKPSVRPLNAPPEIVSIARTEAVDTGLFVKLILALIKVSSNFDPSAIGAQGQQGLMQITPKIAERYMNNANLFDVHQNISIGAQHMRDLLNKYGRLDIALAAYRAGQIKIDRYKTRLPDADRAGQAPVHRYKTMPPDPQIRNFVNAVLSYLDPEQPVRLQKKN